MVYEDLRQPLLEDLYRHSVEQVRLGPVLEQLDDALGALCQATPKELHAGAHLGPSLGSFPTAWLGPSSSGKPGARHISGWFRSAPRSVC